MKVAKLVEVSFRTRVLVEESATEQDIIEASRVKFADKVQTELGENLVEIVNDTEMPYEPDGFDKGE